MATWPMGWRLESLSKHTCISAQPTTKTVSLEGGAQAWSVLKSCTGDPNMQAALRTAASFSHPRGLGDKKDEGVSDPQVAQTKRVALQISDLSIVAKAN